MDKKIQEIRAWNENKKTNLKKLESAGFPISFTSLETIIHVYLDYLLQQIEIKDKALEFYANKNNHHWGVEEEGDVIEPEVMMDYGEIARAALKGEDTNE